jgi:hypothetical protein
MKASGLAAAVLLVAALAGCGTAGGGGAAPATSSPAPALPTGPPPVDERFTPDIPAELRVTDPKDARGKDACELLTTGQLIELGLDPQTARGDTARNGPGCTWKYADGSTRASVALALRPDGVKLPDAYRLRDSFATFEILEIARHPAVRADDLPGECTLNVAVADEQIIVINGYLDDREVAEPCAMARQMAELILSNLPPAA